MRSLEEQDPAPLPPWSLRRCIKSSIIMGHGRVSAVSDDRRRRWSVANPCSKSVGACSISTSLWSERGEQHSLMTKFDIEGERCTKAGRLDYLCCRSQANGSRARRKGPIGSYSPRDAAVTQTIAVSIPWLVSVYVAEHFGIASRHLPNDHTLCIEPVDWKRTAFRVGSG